jgi:hypothetical protein
VESFAKAHHIAVDDALIAWEQYAEDIKGIWNYLLTCERDSDYDRLQM